MSARPSPDSPANIPAVVLPMPADVSSIAGSDLLHISDVDCFLCEPESWRVIHSGRYVRVIAGAGPLCPGYVMIAPKEHFHTAAELPEPVFWEFLSTAEVLKSILEQHYGAGFTAYEHGKLGACIPKEATGAYSTYCHHCHRVFIPMQSHCEQIVERYFNQATALPIAESLRAFSGQPYVYYETGLRSHVRHRSVYTQERAIHSQFMRTILTDALKLDRNALWRADLNVPGIIDTATTLRGDFVGIGHSDRPVIKAASLPPPRRVSLDGLSRVGKSTLAALLSDALRLPVIDTGLIFRLIAHAELTGTPCQSQTILEFLVSHSDNTHLRSVAVTERASQRSSDAEARRQYESILRETLTQTGQCILVGRDCWRFLTEQDLRFLVTAPVETRARRLLLEQAMSNQLHMAFDEALESLRRQDERNAPLLPLSNVPNVRVVNNDRRPLRVAFSDLLARIVD
jgi:CMP/dCMP kinase